MIFPTPQVESENLVIWLKVGAEVPMFALATNVIPDLLPQGGSQCFPFYVYDEDGTNRRENITDWALQQFHEFYGSPRPTGTPLIKATVYTQMESEPVSIQGKSTQTAADHELE